MLERTFVEKEDKFRVDVWNRLVERDSSRPRVVSMRYVEREERFIVRAFNTFVESSLISIDEIVNVDVTK
jgi:hypothetical protein